MLHCFSHICGLGFATIGGAAGDGMFDDSILRCRRPAAGSRTSAVQIGYGVPMQCWVLFRAVLLAVRLDVGECVVVSWLGGKRRRLLEMPMAEKQSLPRSRHEMSSARWLCSGKIPLRGERRAGRGRRALSVVPTTSNLKLPTSSQQQQPIENPATTPRQLAVFH